MRILSATPRDCTSNRGEPSIECPGACRAFLALAIAIRYEAEPSAGFLDAARVLLDPVAARRAELLGYVLRLAYTLSAGTPELLAGTRLVVHPGQLVLQLTEGSGAFTGESVLRRLERLGLALGLNPSIETMSA